MNQKVIVTIDTEGHDGTDPISKLIMGETSAGRYGIERIMDELDAFGIKALFFVDFAEAWDYGEEKVRRVVDTILLRGHNIGVHIHPDHMADKKRLFLWEYSFDEQYDIIKKCTDLYEKMVGKKPLSFRAGKYAANMDTLNILCDLGYQYDFSSFYHQQWCGIDPSFTVNAPCEYRTLIEFPVTMHSTFQLGPINREDKIDIEIMSKGEMRYALDQVIKQDFPVIITLFFHSFSLLNWRKQPDYPQLNNKKLSKLRNALSYATRHETIDFIKEGDLGAILPTSQTVAKKSQIVWKPSLRGVWYTFRKAVPMVKYNRKARYLVVGTGIVMITIIGLLTLLISQIV